MVSVALDAAPLLGRPTGVGVAVAGLLGALGREACPAGGDPVRPCAYGLTARGAGEIAGRLPPGVDVAAARWAERVGAHVGLTRPVAMPAGLLERLWSSALARRIHLDGPPVELWTGPVDVVHGTNFVVPPSRRAARVVTVHDLTAVRFPELCPPVALRYPELVRRAVAEGAFVHTPSEFVAAECRDLLGVPADRVRAVPWGAPSVLAPGPAPGADRPAGAGPSAGPDSPRRPTSPLASGPPYLLGLGTIEPRKDFPLLVRAFDRLAASGDHPDLRLRIVGSPGWGSAALERAVAASPFRDRIRVEGWVEDVTAVLSGAAVFVYPSVYEGFGFPPLEAMARGVPVVATAAGAVPEVVGPAAALVPPGDDVALTTALDGVLADDARRAALVRAGRVRVGASQWSETARGLTQLYRDILK